jgi:DNA primase
MSNDENLAKYKNTADSLVFNKSNILYGIDVMKAKSRESKMNGLIVVEGNVDEISMVKNGFVNTVACMGTALTQFHAKTFARFGDQIYLCLDGDSAGQKAALRSLPILTEGGLSVRVVTIPDSLDPDDYLRKFGADSMAELIKNAVSAVDFRLDCLAVNAKTDDNIGKAKYIKDAIKILNEFETPAEKELYLPKVSAVAGVPIESLRASLNAKTAKSQPVVVVNNIETTTGGMAAVGSGGAPAYNKAQSFVTACIIEKKPFVLSGVELPKLRNPLYDKLCQFALADYDGWVKGKIYNGEFSENDLKNLESVVEYPFNDIGGSEEQKELFDADLKYLRNAEINEQIAELEKQGLEPIAFMKKKQELLKGKKQ